MTQTKKRKKGGKVLASGGFGCVFYPALQCSKTKSKSKKKSKSNSNSVSKLMLTKHAKKEYQLIRTIHSKLKHIPHYPKYFVLDDIHLCNPSPLKPSDLTLFDKKCSIMKTKNIRKKNVNKQLDKLMILNLPYSGTAISTYIYHHGLSNFAVIHQALLDLLKNGIGPMNDAHVYHSDIKASNILLDASMQPRIIDWGLSVEYKPSANHSNRTPFPANWKNRPLQFNVPFSVILFTDDFYSLYSDYLEKQHQVPERTSLTKLMHTYIAQWMKKRGEGHYALIQRTVRILYPQESESESNSQKALDLICKYNVNVLLHHTHFMEDGALNLRKYVNTVFIDIIDVWGFINVYHPILELLHRNEDGLTKDQEQLLSHLKHMYITYLYEPSDPKINIDALWRDLHSLGELF